jgi:hypothetical protein
VAHTGGLVFELGPAEAAIKRCLEGTAAAGTADRAADFVGATKRGSGAITRRFAGDSACLSRRLIESTKNAAGERTYKNPPERRGRIRGEGPSGLRDPSVPLEDADSVRDPGG